MTSLHPNAAELEAEETDDETEDESGSGQICRALLGELREGKRRPGDPLPSENDIMRRFGVSRSMVRDAFAMLAGMGVVDRGRGRRARIRRVSSESLAQLFPLMLELSGEESIGEVYELRSLLEGEAAALAARRGSEEAVAAIRDAAEKYEAHLEGVPTEEAGGTSYVNFDVAFHLAIARASGNATFEHLLEALTAFLNYVQAESCRADPQRQRQAATEHGRIIDAIERGDPDAARLEMRHHLTLSREALEAKLRER